nr:MAG TPA: hypothetical protein [Caudoviricetes sp.]
MSLQVSKENLTGGGRVPPIKHRRTAVERRPTSANRHRTALERRRTAFGRYPTLPY